MHKPNSLLRQKNNEGGIGPIIGALIIVVILIAAAIYYWGQHLNTLDEQQQAAMRRAAALHIEQTHVIMSASSTLGTSTNIYDIQKDLNSIK